jgi:hypothetical protein
MAIQPFGYDPVGFGAEELRERCAFFQSNASGGDQLFGLSAKLRPVGSYTTTSLTYETAAGISAYFEDPRAGGKAHTLTITS